MAPLISVITPSLNQGAFIRDAIESVMDQGYSNVEHIVIDGGSTDQTLDILRSYPHLSWTSAPDRGQSDALNKGFSKARGDIIAWLNADDWYAPGAFESVVPALATRDIVIGAAQETDANKSPRQLVPNLPRGFFELLKYWVPYAWLAQPSVFFRRSLLESVRYPDGRYLDEGLHFAMDYDLWMRMAMRADFRYRLDRTLSYYRIYDTNKTGKHPMLAQRECKRVFRRYERAHGNLERAVSFIVLLDEPGLLGHTLQSLISQTVKDFEVILVDRSLQPERQEFYRDNARSLEESSEHISMRYVRASGVPYSQALNCGADAAAGQLLCPLEAGDCLSADFVQHAIAEFVPDITGAALLINEQPELRNSFRDPTTTNLSAQALFSGPYFRPPLVVRRIAWRDVGGMLETTLRPLAMSDLLTKLIAYGWYVSVDNPLTLKSRAPASSDEEQSLTETRSFINAHLITMLADLQHRDPFMTIRAAHGLAIRPVENMVSVAHEILSKLPPQWHLFSFSHDASELRRLADRYPLFYPLWQRLAHELRERGDLQGADEATGRAHAIANSLGISLADG